MIFRKDINGLRAIAVLPVIFFHVGLPGFSGGFLGVDVFLVISGFLITSSIIRNQSKGCFSIFEFYDKRARRILPPLFFTIIMTTLLSFRFMLPYDLKNFGQSIVATSLAANNILLYLTSGYWSLASEFKPLYHTWSLGVEEQYYFIIPIILLLFFRNMKLKVVMLGLLFLLSFLLSLLVENKEFNFLMVFTRFWELCAGSFLAMYIKDRVVPKSSSLSALGLLLIAASYFMPALMSENQAIINLAPVLGTLMVIAFTPPEGFIYKNLSRKPMLMVGLTSYSVYLFHQPILAFLRLASEGQVNTYLQLSIALLSLPLAYVSWRFIEAPFRNINIVPHKVFYTLLSFAVLSSVATGLFLYKTYGMQNYDLFSKYSYGVNPQAYADKAYSLAKSEFTTTNKKMLIIGNSFARDFYNALAENNVTNGYEVVYLFDYDKDRALSRALLGSADVSFWVSAEGMANIEKEKSYLQESALSKKKELESFSNGNFYYIGTKNYGYNNNFIRFKDWDSTRNYMVSMNRSSLLVEQIESTVFADKYISLMDLFREGDKTRLFTDDHKFISFDTDHITKAGAIYLGAHMLKSTAIKNILL